jgi:hypothetical protein
VTTHTKRPDDECFDAICRSQPEVRHLRSKLFSIGGHDVDLNSLPDRDLPILLALGERFTGAEVQVVKQTSTSFCNVALLWLAQEGSLTGIGAGYALTGSRVWHRHAWGIKNEAIVETTEPHMDYFGCRLTGDSALLFAEKYATPSGTQCEVDPSPETVESGIAGSSLQICRQAEPLYNILRAAGEAEAGSGGDQPAEE